MENKKKILSQPVKHSDKIAKDIINVMMQKEQSGNVHFDEWIEDNPYATDSLNKLSDEKWLKDKMANYPQSNRDLGTEMLVSKIKRKKRNSLIKNITAIAAAVISISFLVYNYSSDGEQGADARVIVATQAPKVGLNYTEPILITTEGAIAKVNSQIAQMDKRVINLDEISQAAEQTNTTTMIDGREILVDKKYNRLVVPEAQTSSIELNDGTVVHLNANSELLFPENFDGESRNVILNGEGYFEVSKLGKPFIVQSGSVEIKVYGTEFNVNSYNIECVQTTLVEGSVAVMALGKKQMLNPSEQCVVDILDGSVSTEVVNTKRYTSWKDGVKVFEEDGLVYLLERLSQWYGVDFVLENNNYDELTFTTVIYNETKLEGVIKLIETLNVNIEFIKTERGGYVVK